MKKLRAILFLGAALAANAATAQSVLLQGGPYTPGHVPMYVGQGQTQPVVQDSGTSANAPAGSNLSELAITSRSATSTYPAANTGNGPFASHMCFYDAPSTNSTGYHFLCLDPNAQGGGLLSYGAVGTATPLPFAFNINGVPTSLTDASITIGSTSITGGTSGYMLYDNGGFLGNSALGSGILTALAATPTGTGGVVLATAPTLSTPTLTGATVTGSFTATGLVTNADLVNVATTVNGQTCTLGATCTVTSVASAVAVGTTTITSGTVNGLLYDSAGVVGNLATANSGVLVTSGAGVPSISTTLPNIALGTPTSVTLTNATGLPFSTGLTGVLQASQSPAYTGDMTSSAGSLTTTVNSIGSKAVTLGAALTTTGAGAATLAFPGSPATFTFPSATASIAQLAAQTFTGVQTFSGAIVMAGSAPSNSGSCNLNTQLGGNTAGSFKANGSCSAGTYVLTFATTMPNGWACTASDLTTPADTVKQTAYTATTASFVATTAAADLITFRCDGF